MISLLKSLSDALVSAITLQNLAILAFIEAIFFPIPPDAVLMPLVLREPGSFFLVACVTTISSVLGALVGYLVGLKGGRPILLRFVSERKVARVEELYQRYDVWSIFIAAFTPIPYKVFAVAAGVFRLSVVRFALASLVGRFSRFFAIAALVAAYGQTMMAFVEEYFEVLTLAVVTFGLLGWWIWRSIARKRAKTV